MNIVEQLALGVVGLVRALGESWRPVVWRTWLPALFALLAVLGVLMFASHPALSWFMAPLLRATAGDEALRYPQLFQRLAGLCVRGDLLVATFVAPLCAGAATRRFAVAFGRPAPAGTVLGDAPALIVASLPAVLVAAGVQLALDALAGVRLSGFTRMLLPQFGVIVVTAAQAATLYVAAEVTLARRSALEALASVPGSLVHGFLPGFLVLALLGLPVMGVATAEPLAAAGRWQGLPELAAAVAALKACAQALVGLVGSGAATLVWLGAIASQEVEE